MRYVCTAALLSLFAIGSQVRAQEQIKAKSMVGIQIKVDDGKIVIQAVVKNSPAEKAGLKENDVLVKVDDTKVKDKPEMDDLHEIVKSIVTKEPGTKVKITVQRGDKEQTVEVTTAKPGEVLPKE
jgi:S1-C subfamily serine protease